MLVLGDILRRHAAVRGDKIAYVIGADRVTYGDVPRALEPAGARAGASRRATRRSRRGPGDESGRVSARLLRGAQARRDRRAGERALHRRRGRRHRGARGGGDLLRVAPSSRPSSPRFARPGGCRAFDTSIALGCTRSAEARRRSTRSPTPRRPTTSRRDIDEHDPHVMLYTSGTTGSPEGHAALAPQLLAAGDDVAPPARASRGRRACSACFPCSTWAAGRCRSASGTPAATAVILAEGRAARHPRDDRARARDVLLRRAHGVRVAAGAARLRPLRPQLAAPARRRHRGDDGGAGARHHGAVPLREHGHPLRLHRSAARSACCARATCGGKPQTVGRPYLDVDVRLVDEGGDAGAAGAVGEITVRSEFTMRGYWRNPEETARTVRDGWVLTGDLGAFDDGGLPLDRRAPQGGDPQRRREHLPRRDRARPARRTRRSARPRSSAIPDAALGRGGGGRRRPARRRDADAPTTSSRTCGSTSPATRGRATCASSPQLPRTAASQQVHKPLLRELVAGADRGAGDVMRGLSARARPAPGS